MDSPVDYPTESGRRIASRLGTLLAAVGVVCGITSGHALVDFGPNPHANFAALCAFTFLSSLPSFRPGCLTSTCVFVWSLRCYRSARRRMPI